MGWARKVGNPRSTSVMGKIMSNSRSYWLINNALQEGIFCLIIEGAQAQIPNMICSLLNSTALGVGLLISPFLWHLHNLGTEVLTLLYGSTWKWRLFSSFINILLQKLASTEAQSFSKTHNPQQKLLLKIIRCFFEKQKQDYKISHVIQNGELRIDKNSAI